MTHISTPQLVNDHTANLQGIREQEYVTFDELTIHGSCWYIFVESIELNYAQGYGATAGFEHDINVVPMRRQTGLNLYASRHVMNIENPTDRQLPGPRRRTGIPALNSQTRSLENQMSVDCSSGQFV